jgi:hypothetical protein
MEADDKCCGIVDTVTDVTIVYRLDGVAPSGGPEVRRADVYSDMSFA